MHLRLAFLGIATLLLSSVVAQAQSAPQRRAVIVGIDDYTAARHPSPAPADRGWDNLSGAVTDATLMREMLVHLYAFHRRDIVLLTDRAATRAAILQAIERHLAQNASAGDILFFYFAGHGSQVRNSLSDEADKLDESIVPADSRTGAPDIRDKELRRTFNRILDRGAQLTVLLDNCHSGSGARGLPTGARPRGIRPDPRDAADATSYGPRPEDRGALVLSAAQDGDQAWETRDDEGRIHGAFSWAWIRAMRDSAPDEPAADTFARAAARMRGERPYQDPVMAGNAEARFRPFLGARRDRVGGRPIVAVERVRGDGTVLLQGGWANGLAVGSELRVVDDRTITTRVVVTAIRGLTGSEARVERGRTLPRAVQAGRLLEIVGWAAPPGRPLRVWMPHVLSDARPIAALAARLAAEARRARVKWVADPLDHTPSHVLRRGASGWELLAADGKSETLGPDAADAMAGIARVPAASSLFVQFPAPASLLVTGRDGIEAVARAEDADYILTGRYVSRHLAYGWVRPAARDSDRRRSGLPLRSAWIAADPERDAAAALRDAVLRLRRIHAWHQLESPPAGRYPYRLALRRARDGEVAGDALVGGEKYEILLRAAGPLPPRVPQRHVYVFVIDSHGQAVLLYPGGGTGSVENRLPRMPPQPQIRLGDAGALEVAPPYGLDTYFLLSTDEPLPNPWILEWDGVRGSGPTGSALERLLALTHTGARSARLVTPATWSIERTVFESVPPRAPRSGDVSSR